MSPQYLDSERGWRRARPLPTSRRLKMEVWLWRHRLRWLARLSIRVDERRLGR